MLICDIDLKELNKKLEVKKLRGRPHKRKTWLLGIHEVMYLKMYKSYKKGGYLYTLKD